MLVLFGPLSILLLIAVVVLLLAPAAIDFVNRSEGLTGWWILPFLLVPLPVMLLLALPFGERDVLGQSTLASAALGVGHLAMAAFFAVLGLGMAASRGLRPDGPTQRRRRTSLAAVVLLMVPLLVPLLSLSLFWMMSAFMVGVLWVVAMNRRGPSRMERGKALSAGMLVASGLQAGWVLAHGAWYTDLMGNGSDFLIGPLELVVGGMVLVLLVGGLRFLADSVHPLFPILSLLSGVSLAIPMAWWSTRPPIPAHDRLPEWVDLMGDQPTQLSRVRHPECYWTTGQPVPESYPCRYYLYALLPADAPLSMAPPNALIAVEDGERAVQETYSRWGPDLHVREVGGLAQVDGVEGTHAIGPALHAVLQSKALSDRPLRVHASPNWTVQQYVSMCASTGTRPSCAVSQ